MIERKMMHRENNEGDVIDAITEDVDRVAISDNNLSAEKQQTCGNCGKEGTNLNICNKLLRL